MKQVEGVSCKQRGGSALGNRRKQGGLGEEAQRYRFTRKQPHSSGNRFRFKKKCF